MLWRYMQVADWMRISADRRLGLTRLGAFNDGFECQLPSFVQETRQMASGRPIDDAVARLHVAARRQMMNYASCWYADEQESIAMWERFVGRGRPGVAVGVLFDDLRRLVPAQAIFGPVTYVRLDDPDTDVCIDRPWLWPLFKLWGYRSEHEVRVIISRKDELLETDDDDRWGYLKGSDLMAIVRKVRVFAPTFSETQQLEKIVGETIQSGVTFTSAYPHLFRFVDGVATFIGTAPIVHD